MSKNINIVGDVGGTNARLAISEENGIGEIHPYTCAEFDSVGSIITQFGKDQGITLSDSTRLVLAVAGPTGNPESFMFSNNDAFGVTNFTQLGQDIGTDIILLNDFAAQAYGALALKRDDLKEIISGSENAKIPGELWDKTASSNISSVIQIPPDNRFIIAGPGTGLGVCTLGVNISQILIMDGEGGHSPFASLSLEEQKIVEDIWMHQGEVSYEKMASGKGLVNIWKSVKQQWDNTTILGKDITSAVITGANETTPEGQAVALFTKAFGRSVANAALVNHAKGGVIIPAGSIISFLGEHFNITSFETEFRKNDFAPENNPLRNTPVYMMQTEETGILGAHVYTQTLG